MKTCKVTLLTSNGATNTEIPKSLLGELINSLTEKGEEQVHTTNGSYTVTGVVIGDVKDKVLIL
jgi:hypothetical protein